MITETILVASNRPRDMGQLDHLWSSTAPMPSLDALLVAANNAPSSFVLGGGEPTLRSDLPELIGHLGTRTRLATDGLVLHKADTVRMLRSSGLERVRIGLHSARADAHDWLVGIPGAHRRTRTAIEVTLSAGVDVEVEIVVTRPTAPYLDETVALLLRAGVRRIRFRPIRQINPSDTRYAATAPRYGLMQPSLQAAARLALRQGASIKLVDFPHCAAPGFDECYQAAPRWLVPDGISAPSFPSQHPARCPGCECGGAPADYVALFGWGEFSSEIHGPLRPTIPSEIPQSGEDAKKPPPRSTVPPATRVAEAIRLSEHSNLGGDPMPPVRRPALPDVVAIDWTTDETTRTVKRRMVNAAQVGARTLQVLGDLGHSESLHLLREALRLSFDQVVVTADLTGLGQCTDKDLFHLRGLHHVWTPALQPSVDVAERLAAVAKVEFAVRSLDASSTPVSPFGRPTSLVGDGGGRLSWPKWTANQVE